MRIGFILTLGLGLASAAARAALPPAVDAVLPQLERAERRLQDASLVHEAARREALPAEAAVAAARKGTGTWWGAWRHRRVLARLKERLDRVEQARVERSAAKEELFILLTAAEEELRSALERGAAAGKPDPAALDWWRRLQAWSQRLEALESAPLEKTELGGERRVALLAQARLEQIGRDLRLAAALARQKVLRPAQAAADRARIEAAQKRWKKLAAGAP